MNIKLTPALMLTDERPETRPGICVLVNRYDDSISYGPRDLIDVYQQGPQPAAVLVRRYGSRFTGERREAVGWFLSQWPEGPQLEGGE